MITTVTTTSAPVPYLWTSEEFQRLGEVGIFGDQRIELIEGQVFYMSPVGRAHVVGLMLLSYELPQLVGRGYSVLVQGPLAAGERSQPMPDGMILRGSPRDYSKGLPTNAVLVIEISESSLNFDRTVKAKLYANANIPEYWIINLFDNQIEVLRDPQPGVGYTSKSVAKKGDSIKLVAASELTIEAGKLIP